MIWVMACRWMDGSGVGVAEEAPNVWFSDNCGILSEWRIEWTVLGLFARKRILYSLYCCCLLFAEVNGVAGKLCLLLLLKWGRCHVIQWKAAYYNNTFFYYKSGDALVQLRSGWVWGMAIGKRRIILHWALGLAVDVSAELERKVQLKGGKTPLQYS